MRKEELKRYQKCAQELLERVRKRESYGEDLSEVKKLLKAFFQALREGDSFQADYLLQLVNSALENGGDNFSPKVERNFGIEEGIKKRGRQNGWVKSYRKKGSKLPRRLSSSLIILVAILLVLSTLGIASARSLPDSALYPVKRGIEKLREGVVFSPSGKASFQLDLAQERLREAEGMKKKGKEKLAQKAFEEMKEHIKKGKIWADISNSSQLKERVLEEEGKLLREAKALKLEEFETRGSKVKQEKKEASFSSKEKKTGKEEGKEKESGEKGKSSKEAKPKREKKNTSDKGKSKNK